MIQTISKKNLNDSGVPLDNPEALINIYKDEKAIERTLSRLPDSKPTLLTKRYQKAKPKPQATLCESAQQLPDSFKHPHVKPIPIDQV